MTLSNLKDLKELVEKLQECQAKAERSEQMMWSVPELKIFVKAGLLTVDDDITEVRLTTASSLLIQLSTLVDWPLSIEAH